jgi:type II secretory pathway component GspD/PulD (secretin)
MIPSIIATAAWWQTAPANTRLHAFALTVPTEIKAPLAEWPTEELIAKLTNPVPALAPNRPVLPPVRLNNDGTATPVRTASSTLTAARQENTTVTTANRTTGAGAPNNPTIGTPVSIATEAVAEKRITVQVQDTDVASVLAILSEQIGTNLVLQGGGDKKVTLNLRDIAFEKALQAVCNMTDLWYIQLPGMWVVGTQDLLKSRYPNEFRAAYPHLFATAGEKVEFVQLNYVDASQAADMLRGQWKEDDLKVSIAPSMWAPELSNTDTSEVLGLSSGGGSSSNSGSAARTGTIGGGDSSSKVVVLRGSGPIVEAAAKLLKQLDFPRPTVAITVEIVDIKNSAFKDLGMKWDFGNLNFTENNPPGVGIMPFQRDPFSFRATISAMVRDGAAKILAQPNVNVLDGRSAYVLIGEKINFPEISGLDSNGRPIFTTREERVGIYLQVAPSVSDNDTVTMNVYPQVSAITGFTDFAGGGRYPNISTRETKSSVSVRSGDTLIIGGLLQDQDIKNWQSVPFLSQIPFFGELFKWRSTNKEQSQVVISITPRIIRPTQSTAETNTDGTR